MLLDVMLPGLDGIELLTRMKGSERFRDIPVIEKIWGKSDHCQTRTVDIHIQTLRKKLGSSGSLIECERTIGYRIRKTA